MTLCKNVFFASVIFLALFLAQAMANPFSEFKAAINPLTVSFTKLKSLVGSVAPSFIDLCPSAI